jgi:hypothetical protein
MRFESSESRILERTPIVKRRTRQCRGYRKRYRGLSERRAGIDFI